MALDNHFVVFSGWGVTSNWYRNLRVNPEVTITVGRRRMGALARLVDGLLAAFGQSQADLLGYSFGEIPNAVWRGQPWVVTVKYFVDGIVYALITAATFCWLWPA